MKKIICLTLALVFILVGICGCNLLDNQPVTLADSISIPNDGIIEASVFEEMKNKNKAVTFKGQSEDICYEWIVFGSDIKEAKSLNLGIKITEANSEKVVFRFLSDKNFGFSPTLSIYINDLWKAQSASLRETAVSDETKTQEVSITGEKQSILNFSPKIQTGDFIITPNGEQKEIASSSSVSKSVSETNPSENSKTSKISKSSKATTSSDTQPQTTESKKTSVSKPVTDSQRPTSGGESKKQDKYKTDSVPKGKPLPVEPDDQKVDDKKTLTCTLSIECTSILNHLSELNQEKLDILPKNGIIFATHTVTFYEGESVYDVLKRVCQENKIHLEASFTPMYNSSYVEGIGNLYEFDCGSGSGWMYRVDGWYPNYGCSRYQLKQGEKIEWRYTCDLGKDIGGRNVIE